MASPYALPDGEHAADDAEDGDQDVLRAVRHNGSGDTSGPGRPRARQDDARDNAGPEPADMVPLLMLGDELRSNQWLPQT